MPLKCAAVSCTEYATKQSPYSFHLPLKMECGCPSGGGIKNGHIHYPSYMEERRKKYFFWLKSRKMKRERKNGWWSWTGTIQSPSGSGSPKTFMFCVHNTSTRVLSPREPCLVLSLTWNITQDWSPMPCRPSLNAHQRDDLNRSRDGAFVKRQLSEVTRDTRVKLNLAEMCSGWTWWRYSVALVPLPSCCELVWFQNGVEWAVSPFCRVIIYLQAQFLDGAINLEAHNALKISFYF